jgi:hypothetical protein
VGILIMITTFENLDPRNRFLFFPIGAIPVFVIHNWVFLAILLGDTGYLPEDWETFWDRSEAHPAKFDQEDRRALGLSIGGLLIGNGVAFFRIYQAQGLGSLGWVILGALLADIFAFGVFFWTFRRSHVLRGLLLLGLWAILKNFSFGIELARDLGVFLEWLVNRFLGLVIF